MSTTGVIGTIDWQEKSVADVHCALKRHAFSVEDGGCFALTIRTRCLYGEHLLPFGRCWYRWLFWVLIPSLP